MCHCLFFLIISDEAFSNWHNVILPPVRNSECKDKNVRFLVFWRIFFSVFFW